jgi:hypothetical protein
MAAQRRNEIGVRMALGADRGRVIGLVMSEASFLLMIGLIAETALALDGARRLHSAIRSQAVRRLRRSSPRAQCWPASTWWQAIRRHDPHPASIRCTPCARNRVLL